MHLFTQKFICFENFCLTEANEEAQ